MLTRFAGDLVTVRTALDDLLDNFAATDAQGPAAYAEQMVLDHRELDCPSLLAEAVIAGRNLSPVALPRLRSARPKSCWLPWVSPSLGSLDDRCLSSRLL